MNFLSELLSSCLPRNSRNRITNTHSIITATSNSLATATSNSLATATTTTGNPLVVEDVNATNKYRETPLHLASTPEIAKLLIANGEDVDAKDKYGCTPLHWAVYDENLEITQLLIEHGAEVNTTTVDSETPLHRAVINGHLATAQLLIENGANVNTTDNDGRTSLHWASKNGRLAIAKLLIENRADVNATDKYGRTPLHWASLTKNQEVAQYIKKHLKTTFLSKLNSDIARLQKEGKQDEIDNLFNSPISLENVATADAEIILLNNHLYTNTELETLTQCPMTRIPIKDCDKLDVTNEIKKIWKLINLITPPPTQAVFHCSNIV